MTRSRLATIHAGALVPDIARLLSGGQKNLVVVCDPSGAMVGIVTKTNIVQQVGQCETRVRSRVAADIMVRQVAFCHGTDLLPDVLTMMAELGFVHVPVIDHEFKPVGIVTARDAMRALLAEEQYEASLLRDYVMGVGYQ